MRPLMIVVPNKLVHGATARGKREERPHVETLVVDGPKEAFDLAVRLRRIRPEQVMRNLVGRADLLEPRQAVGVERGAS